MEILIKIVYFLMSLSLLVFLHEMGHFVAARMFKIRVDKFYLFFDFLFPMPNLLKFSLFKKKIGDTEWGLGWFPMGGYVQINGMIDESMDKETMAQPEQPWEFRSKPAWQRLIVMIGGVVVNFVLGVLIFIFIMNKWGAAYLATSDVKYGIYADSVGRKCGLQNGDKIVKLDNKTVEVFYDLPAQIILNNAKTIEIIRDSTTLNLTIPEGVVTSLIQNKTGGFIEHRKYMKVFKSAKNGPADKAGIMKGDQIIGIGGTVNLFHDQLRDSLKLNKGTTRSFIIKRNNELINKDIAISDAGLLGIQLEDSSDIHYSIKKYTLVQAIPVGWGRAIETLSRNIKGLGQLFKSFVGKSEVKASDSLGGFLSMGEMFPSKWGQWESFWTLTAILSLILAFMNLLPIPALDGGHVVFCLWEMITGRKPGIKVLEYSQYVGMAILLALMLFANGNDVYKFFFK
jgi:regulator of sigma E protease